MWAMDRASNIDHPGHAVLRHGRRSITGQAYLVTTVTANRQPWMTSWLVARAVAREVGGRRLWRGSRVHAWVLMPDHMHVLLTLGDDESLSHLMNRVKSVSARAAHTVTESAQPVWTGAFHDHALRRDEDIAIAARYVITNPVRAGLVDTIWNWPFWDSEWLPEPGTAELEIARKSGRPFRASYRSRGSL